MVRRLRQLPPLGLLAIVLALSLAARATLLEQPCRIPCRSASDHVLVFDEDYYVNAARVIAGVQLAPNERYASAPTGSDPNAEHPQLAKLIIAGSIELFGDGPFAWRLGSLVFGTLAILGLYVLVRAAGGTPLLAVGASALMAADNLLLVHGRIGTLDVYVVAAMIWGVAMYLRGRPLVAGVLLGVGACFKLVAPYALFALAVLELLRRGRMRRTATSAGGWRAASAGGWRALLLCAVTTAVVFVALLAALDAIARPYDPVTAKFVAGGPFAHIWHMLTYATKQTSPHGPTGIASYPWQWLGDYKPIVYLNINPAEPSAEFYAIHPAVHFLGMISPPLMLLAVPGLILAGRRLWRQRSQAAADARDSGRSHQLDTLALAWFAGTWIPLELASMIWSRTSYLYYMVIVMPAIYVAVARLIAGAGRRRVLVGIWVALVVAAVIVMYPFTPLP